MVATEIRFQIPLFFPDKNKISLTKINILVVHKMSDTVMAAYQPANRLLVSPNEAREPVDILLMPPFCDTSSWYHKMIG